MTMLTELAPFDETSFEAWLTPKQEVFVQEYLIDCNASKSSLRAGVSPQTGIKWLCIPLIASRIRMAIEQRIARTKITQDMVLHETSLLAFSRVDHYSVDDDGYVSLAEGAPQGAMAAVQSIKRKIITRTDKGEDTREVHVEIKLWDKPTPLKLMGKHVGLFPDRMEHTGAGGGPIEAVTKIEREIIDVPAS